MSQKNHNSPYPPLSLRGGAEGGGVNLLRGRRIDDLTPSTPKDTALGVFSFIKAFINPLAAYCGGHC